MDRIGDEIAKELGRSGSRDAVPLGAVTAAWPEVVGDTVARRAWPLRIARDGTLHVATASSTWAHELDLLGPEILERLAARVGNDAPRKLRFAVGPIPEPEAAVGASSAPRDEPAEVPPEVELEASAAVAAIDDPDFRELVARAARASLVRARSGR
jgi:predicted nucleic acid-binding Zn ribbon protein